MKQNGEQQALGGNIHLRYLKNPGKLIERWKPYNPSTLTVMVDDNEPGKEDQTKYIVELAAALPDTLIVSRVKHRMDGGYHTKPVNNPAYWVASPDDFLNKWQHLGVGNMTLYALNEPDDGIDDKGVVDREVIYRLNSWFVETAEKAAQRGVSISGPNFGKGIPALGPDGEWNPEFDPILIVLSKHRGLHFLTLHEYGPEDDPYHMGRYKAALRRCVTLGLPPPRFIFTEIGADKADTGDSIPNGYKSRGWSGTYFVNWLIDKLKRIYKPDIEAGIIVGLDVFSDGASSPEWEPFNFEEDEGFWGELTRAQKRGDLMRTKPIRQFVPKPENARTPLQVQIVTGSMRNIRSGPGTHFNDDGDVQPNQVITLYDFPLLTDGQKLNWKWVDLTPTLGGWMCVSDIQIKVVEALPRDPIPPTPIPESSPVVELPKPSVQTFSIPMVMKVDAENEEIATMLARYMAVAMDGNYRQLRYDAELLKRIDQIKSVSFSIEFSEPQEVTS